MNKFEQVSSDHQQMSVAGVGTQVPCLKEGARCPGPTSRQRELDPMSG